MRDLPDSGRSRRERESEAESEAPNLSILVEHAYDLVGDVKNVPPVKVWHARVPLLLWTSVQKVQNVFGGKVSVFQTVVHEVHHSRVLQGVLQGKGHENSLCKEPVKDICASKVIFLLDRNIFCEEKV